MIRHMAYNLHRNNEYNVFILKHLKLIYEYLTLSVGFWSISSSGLQEYLSTTSLIPNNITSTATRIPIKTTSFQSDRIWNIFSHFDGPNMVKGGIRFESRSHSLLMAKKRSGRSSGSLVTRFAKMGFTPVWHLVYLTRFLGCLLVKMAYTLHVLAKRAPKAVVKPIQIIHTSTLNWRNTCIVLY